MAKLGLKSKLLELLRETPIVTFACKKVGLNPSTFYAWHKDDIDFRNQADEVLIIGKRHINDMCKATIIKEIDKGNMRAVVFWLEHNDPDYRPVRTTYVDPISHTHQLKPGEICKSCGYFEPEIEEYKHNKKGMSDKQLSDALYKRLRSINTRKQSEPEIRKIIDDFIEKNNLGNIEIHFVDGSKKEEKNKDNKDDTESKPNI